MSMFDPPRARARKSCRARIDGRHSWLYVGGTTARCEGCGAEKFYDPVAARTGEETGR
jgi:hypothetical protein